jgi:hypothetical protein
VPWRAAALLAAALTLAGCETVHSKDIRTSGIRAGITVLVDGRDTTVSVLLSAGSLTSIELDHGDSLTASGGGRTITLKRSNFLGRESYNGVLSGVTKPGTAITVALDRKAGDTDAPHSTIRLPALVRASVPGRVYSRSRDSIPLHVSAGVGELRVESKGSCTVGNSVGDTLQGPPFVLPSGSLRSFEASAHAPRRCDVTLALWRVEHGPVDSAYGGGGMTAERATTVVVRSAP